jgi:hypothetical protein
MCCSSARQRHAFDRRHCGLARHLKTDPTETMGLCFVYPKTPCLRADGSCLPEHMNRALGFRINFAKFFCCCGAWKVYLLLQQN